jgi:hypothetical protein
MRGIYDAPNREPTSDSAPWFHYGFDIVDAHVTDQDRLHIVANAAVRDAVAGFGLEFERSGWRRDQVSADIWFDWGRGSLFSIGEESDVFARFLSREIGDGNEGRFVEMVETDVVMLNSRPDAMLTEWCYTKFFLGEDEDSESQVFINFDVPNGLVEFKEKDLDYRPNLLAELVWH